MASIIERGGRFLVRVRRQGYPTVTKTFTRKVDGVAWARRVEVEMETGRWDSPARSSPTLREAVQEYRRVVAPRFKGASTYRYRYDEFERLSFADRAIHDVRPSDFSQWRDKQLLTLKPGTVVRKMAMLSGIFRWAQHERGWVTTNPVAGVKRPKASDARNRVLTDMEAKWLMSAAATSKARWLRPALIVLLQSAMRRGELCKLRVQDIDRSRAIARLHETKNGEARDVPLCPQALSAIDELIQAARARSDDHLLPLGPAGSLSTRFKVTIGRARRTYQSHCIAAGIAVDDDFLRDVRLHDLRHHAVTSWSLTGQLSIAELMAVSGHKSVKMLMRYTHVQPAAVAQRLAAIGSSPLATAGHA